MSTAIGLERLLSIDRKIEMQAIGPGFRLPVFVIFTSINRTLKALEKAGQLANPLRTRIEIIAVQTVPFTLPLDEPPVPFEFVVRRLEEMANQFQEQIKISAYLCRDSSEALKCVLNRNCPVVMGVRKRLWPTRDERLARKLRRAGYNVTLVETE
jgi:hypothetical protein